LIHCHFPPDSSNGTFVNQKKIGKGNQTLLYNGDQISFLKPDKPATSKSDAPIAYFFNMLKPISSQQETDTV